MLHSSTCLRREGGTEGETQRKGGRERDRPSGREVNYKEIEDRRGEKRSGRNSGRVRDKERGDGRGQQTWQANERVKKRETEGKKTV